MPDLPAAAEALGLMAFALGVAELERGYADVRAGYRELVHDNVLRYLVQDGARSTSFKAAVGRAVAEAFPEAFYIAYVESSGGVEVERADDQWLTQRINDEIGHVAGMFESLRALKGKQLPPGELQAEAERRADGYAQSLDAVAAEGALRGKKRKMYTWHLGRTEKHCATCAWLDGQRHTAKWFIDRNFIPGKPGSATDCQGYHCDCKLKDDDGNVFEVEF